MANTRRFTRREMLRLSAGSLLAAGLWPGALWADDAAPSGGFHFIVVNDTHYIDAGCGKWLEGVIRQMKEHPEKIDFCLLVGDLSHEGKPGQLAPVRDILAGLGKPTHVVVGNHDYLTQEDRRAYEQLYPNRLNYHFEHDGWQFVALDSTEGQHALNTKIHASTLKWVDQTLPRLDKKRPIILFTHFPLGPWVYGRPANAAEVLERFKEYNLQAVFNGHLHAFTERKVGPATITTNKCCSFRKKNHDNSKEKGYFLCSAKNGKITRKFVEVQPG